MNAATAAPLPWHAAAIRNLNSAWEQDRWPHALLIHGAEGLGKRHLARWLAQSALCDRVNKSLSPCGSCTSCTLFQAGTHPDYREIAPEEDKQQISVEQIREACTELTLTSFRQGCKIAVVDPAHAMTLAAANSLLKTLEEPTDRSLLILLSVRPAALLPTIRSRCQHIGIAAPREEEALRWLASAASAPVSPEILRFAGGAPLRALTLAQGQYATLWGELGTGLEALFARRTDVTQLAKQWVSDDLADRLLCLDHWLMQRIRATVGQTDEFVTGPLLPSDAPALNISRMFVCLDRVRELQSALARTALQRELALEAVLLTLAETFGSQIRQ